MSGEEVWLSELETGLSSSEDHGALEAHNAIDVGDLEPLTTKSSQELMSSQVHKVLGESLYLSGKYLAYEKKLASLIPQMESLSSENALLKEKVFSLESEATKTQDHLKVLEKDISTEKAFSKLKDKQIEEALAKISKVGAVVVEKFKDFDEYFEKLCDYYVKGFVLFRKCLAKHHLELDFSKVDVE
nr:hypothetical protein CFP56_07098 [Quercus suber]